MVLVRNKGVKWLHGMQLNPLNRSISASLYGLWYYITNEINDLNEL